MSSPQVRWTYVGPGSKARVPKWKQGGPYYKFVGPSKNRRPQGKKEGDMDRVHRRKLNTTRIRSARRVLRNKTRSLLTSQKRARKTLQRLVGNTETHAESYASATADTHVEEEEAMAVDRHPREEVPDPIGDPEHGPTDDDDLWGWIMNEPSTGHLRGMPEVQEICARWLDQTSGEVVLDLIYNGDPSHLRGEGINSLREKAAAVAGVMLTSPEGVPKLQIPNVLKKVVRHYMSITITM